MHNANCINTYVYKILIWKTWTPGCKDLLNMEAGYMWGYEEEGQKQTNKKCDISVKNAAA